MSTTQTETLRQSLGLLPYLLALMAAVTGGVLAYMWTDTPVNEAPMVTRATVELLVENPTNVALYAKMAEAPDLEVEVDSGIIRVTGTHGDPEQAEARLKNAQELLAFNVLQLQNKEANNRLRVWRESQRIVSQLGFTEAPPSVQDLTPVHFGTVYVHRPIYTELVPNETAESHPWRNASFGFLLSLVVAGMVTFTLINPGKVKQWLATE